MRRGALDRAHLVPSKMGITADASLRFYGLAPAF